MAKLVTGLFNTRSSAMLAIEDLLRHGIPQADVSLMLTDTNVGREFFTDMASKAPEGGVTGAILGGILGGILAALVHHGSIQGAAMGLTSVTLAIAILTGIGAGGVVGLIIGAIIGAAYPEYEVRLYRQDRRQGGLLAGVYCHTRRVAEVRRLLEAAGGTQIRTKSVPEQALPEIRTASYMAGNRSEAENSAR